jgi:hypothetical protein
MKKINYSTLFDAKKSPTLDEFTLGFLFASHSDLDKYEEFSERESTNEDLSYLSVMLMKDECEEVQSKISHIIKKIKIYGLLENQLGYDFWHCINHNNFFYLQHLPPSIKEETISLFKIYGHPCELIKNSDNHFIFSYKDKNLQNKKEHELLSKYMGIADSDINQTLPKYSIY